MFVRIKKSGANEYLQIVQNYREGHKPKQRVIGTLGRVDEVAGSRDIDTLNSSYLNLPQNLPPKVRKKVITMINYFLSISQQ